MDENVSPWGLLAACLAHRMSHVPPNVVLVKNNGKEGATLAQGTSLNVFVGMVAPPGGGKSVTFRLASELIPPKDIPLADGTGQGLVKAFAERKKISKDDEGKTLDNPYMVTRFHRHSLTLHAPEIDTLNAEFAREGSKTGGMMRSLWVGETVGMTNADNDRNAVLPRNMARLCGIWGVQPQNAFAIMAQAGSGTPQRFLWVPARDRRRTRAPHLLTNVARPPLNTTFPFPVFGNTPPGIAMGSSLPLELRDDDPLPDAIWIHHSPQMALDCKAAQNAYDEAMGDAEDYDDLPPEVEDAVKAAEMAVHVILQKLKIAAGLGFLWGNAEPDDTDVELAGALLELSMGEAAGVWKVCQKDILQSAQQRGAVRGVELEAAITARDAIRAARLGEVADTVYTILAKAGGCTPNGVKKKITATKREMVRDALHRLEDEGRANYDGTTWRAVYNGRVLD
ncbi:hypothetical protein [Mycobacteroides abscessus]|uniref:hypothetical protein n=1 Tax=Mycobacteroides abscessus TaxID=36809 RepID=UPI00103CCC50|nr:hypothetical protein [Mycobacteroides abscessus]